MNALPYQFTEKTFSCRDQNVVRLRELGVVEPIKRIVETNFK
jgi:hypothetical protein